MKEIEDMTGGQKQQNDVDSYFESCGVLDNENTPQKIITKECPSSPS